MQGYCQVRIADAGGERDGLPQARTLPLLQLCDRATCLLRRGKAGALREQAAARIDQLEVVQAVGLAVLLEGRQRGFPIFAAALRLAFSPNRRREY